MREIFLGDCRELIKTLPNESVDIIFTDPPYFEKDMWTWEWLSQECPRVMKPGTFLLTYVGKHALPTIYKNLESLEWEYYWQLESVFLNSHTAFFDKAFFSCHHPILVYCKKPVPKRHNKWCPDARANRKSDKRFHEWGQGLEVIWYYLQKFADPGALVFDPFVGGGTVPAAARLLNMNYIGFEIDENSAQVAKNRLVILEERLKGG